ncbi:MAG TPA: DHH family phosphoesterase [Candidatus Saccharimonadales bacterium]|nr:DHH family phosphoesterase [Candidatus Saccharimonadales bacterium]
MYAEADQITQIIGNAQKIVVLQADNPDGDSLASSLALEQILGDLGKDVYLYCGMDMPAHLHYLPGWDRVNKDFPSQFDAAIIVDTSADSLFEILNNSGQKGWLKSKPVVVIDHHATEATIDYAEVMCVHPAVATGEVLYELGHQLNWPLNRDAKNMLAISILSDSLGLMSEGTSARSIHIIAELVEGGIKLAELENERRELMRKSPDILQYKGKLIERIEYSQDGRIATVVVPWEEIEQYSQEYNPSMLVLDEMRLVSGVDVAIAFKVYKDGKITGKIRCNYGKAIGRELAEHFGGGGHPYASGFKITNGKSLEDVRAECIQIATELLDELGQESNHD